MKILPRDLRFALRQLRKHPGFSAVAVLTLAIGIAAATAVFSLVNAVLLNPVPLPHADRLVSIDTLTKARAARMAAQMHSSDNTSWLDFFDWRSGSKSFDGMAAYHGTNGIVGRAGEPLQRMSGVVMSAGMMHVLGLRPQLGRDFLPQEELAGNRSVILSHSLWQTQFAGASDVLGKLLRMNEESYTVVGVLPRGFAFPGMEEAQFWVTESHDREGKNAMATQRGWQGIGVLGHLRDSVSLPQAAGEVNRIQAGLAKQYPNDDADKTGAQMQTLAESLTGDVRQPLRILLAAVAFLLLIGCVNVAGLLLTRAMSRSGELAVRAALGASRAAIVRQLLLEALTLSFAGGLLGTAAAALVLRLAPRYLPRGLPHAEGVALDWRVLAFALAVSVLTGLLFGVLPAWRASRQQPAGMLGGNGRTATQGRGRHRLHGALVIGETALSLLMLVGAGLMLRSFQRVLTVDPGFDTEHLLSFRIAAPAKHFTDAQTVQFAQQLQARLAGLPGVRAATYGFPLPLSGGNMSITFTVPGHDVPPGEQPSARVSLVAQNFFAAMRIPVLRGRSFTTAEDQLHGRSVLLVNEVFAKQYFPGQDALGKHIVPGIGPNEDGPQAAYEIIGIVADTKRLDLTEAAEPEYYMPLSQATVAMPPFALRTTGDPMQLADTVRRIVAEQDSALPVFAVYSYDTLLERNTAMRRFQTILLTGFAAVALLLAAIGLYASLSYMVVERTPELGLRIALGSQRAEVLSLVLRRGLWLAAAGLCLGVIAAAGLTRYVASLLFGVRPLDIATFTGTALLLFAVCGLSSLVPAWRASRLNPIDTLRQQ